MDGLEGHFNVGAEMTPLASNEAVSIRDGGVELEIHVVPRSTREALLGLHDGALRVALTSPPVEGAANDALVAFLARALSVPKRQVTLVRGDKSRRKRVRVLGADVDAVEAWLSDAGVPSR